MRTSLFALAALAALLAGGAARAQAACDGGCTSGPSVTLSPVPSYTNNPSLELDASVRDDVAVQSVTMIVQSPQAVAQFPATQLDGGDVVPGGVSGDGGVADAGFSGDAGLGDGGVSGGGSDAGLGDGGVSGGGSDGGFVDDGGTSVADGGSSDGGVSVADGGSHFSAWQALVTLFEGPNSVTAVATDVNGSVAGSAPQTIVLDSAPPDVQVISPAAGQVFSGTQVDVNLIVSDATPATVSITSPAGTTIATPDPSGTLTTVANFPDAGASSLRIVATDSASNVTSLSVPVFIDVDAPVLTTTLPDGQQSGALPGNAFPWTVNVADVATVTLAFSPGQSTVSLPRGGGSATASLPLVEGINLFQVAATSESGHVAALQRTFTYDTTPPTGSIEVPQANEPLRGTVELTAAAQDALTGVASVEIGVDSAGTFAAPVGNGLWIAPFDTHGVSDGEHTAVAILTDAVGNTVTLTQAFLSDNTPPQVAVASPPAGTYIGGGATITAIAQDATTGIVRIDVLVDGKPVGTCAASPCSVVYASSTQADGAATISAQATDGAGNTALSDAIPVAMWQLDMRPSVLVLKGGGGGTAGLHVRGPGAELLRPIAQRLQLAVPGGPLVPVLGAAGGPGETVLQVDRAALIGSLRASAAAGVFTPPATVQISLRDGTAERGRSTMQVR